jgi:hypothetical protein
VVSGDEGRRHGAFVSIGAMVLVLVQFARRAGTETRDWWGQLLRNTVEWCRNQRTRSAELVAGYRARRRRRIELASWWELRSGLLQAGASHVDAGQENLVGGQVVEVGRMAAR